MLLILEVLLTVTTWRKGWGPMALLPLAIGVPVGVVLMGATQSLVPGFLTDVLITIALLVMNANVRKPSLSAQPAPAREVTHQNAA